MVLRATRQTAHVLGSGDGDVRVTRQWVYVLARSDLYEDSATDTLTITDSATIPVISVNATDTLVISDVAIGLNDEKDAADTLNISDLATYSSSRVEAADTLTIVDEAIGHIAVTTSVNATDTLVMSDDATWTLVPDTHVVEDTLTIVQVADYQIVGRDATDTLTITDVALVDNTTKTADVVDALLLIHVATYGGTTSYELEDNLTEDYVGYDPATGFPILVHYGLGQRLRYDLIRSPAFNHRLQIEDAVTLVHVKVSGTSVNATDTLTITDSAEQPTEALIDTLTISDLATVIKSTPIVDTLTISDSVIVEQILNPSITDALEVTHAVTYLHYENGTLCRYSPFVGTSSDLNAPHPPSMTSPTIVKHSDIVFTYPAIGPSSTLTLRAPEFGDRDRLHFQRINRESRGGTLTVFADPIWPKVETMVIDFRGLTEAEGQATLTFIMDSLGQEIGIRDWEGKDWIGVITNPDTPLIRDGKDCPGRGISLSLELDITEINERLEAEDTLAMTQSATNVIVP